MHSLTAALCALLLTAGALTSPTPQTPRLDKREFKHHVKRTIVRRGPDAGADAMARAYRKFGFDAKHLERREPSPEPAGTMAGKVAAVPEPNEAEYLSPVTIGGQQLTLDFDTGSSDLWVFSSALSQSTIGGHSVYNPQASKTFTPLNGHTWSISYGDGSGAAGTVGKDTVVIGGVTATQQAVEMATAVSQSFVKDANNDGLVGLGFGMLNTVKPNKQSTFFETIMPQLALPVFSVDLRNDSLGTYHFGGIDTSKFRGRLTTIPVKSSTGFWQVDSPTFVIGSSKIANAGASPAIADTGTSLLLVDPQVADAYYQKVRGATNNAKLGGYTYPCAASLPAFGVALGTGYMAMIPSAEITFAQVDGQTCFGGIQSNGGANLQIYGDVLFKAQYAVFDGQNKVMQFAPKF